MKTKIVKCSLIILALVMATIFVSGSAGCGCQIKVADSKAFALQFKVGAQDIETKPAGTITPRL